MPPETSPSNKSQAELFRSQLEQIIDMNHALVKLSEQIDWKELEESFELLFCADNGRAVIGHLKSDHRLDRNRLKGKPGDQLNALLSACGWNIKKLLRAFFCPNEIIEIFRFLFPSFNPFHSH